MAEDSGLPRHFRTGFDEFSSDEKSWVGAGDRQEEPDMRQPWHMCTQTSRAGHERRCTRRSKSRDCNEGSRSRKAAGIQLMRLENMELYRPSQRLRYFHAEGCWIISVGLGGFR